jgi:hypothetical protein
MPLEEHRDYWLHNRLPGIEKALDALLSFAGLKRGLGPETVQYLVDVRDNLRKTPSRTYRRSQWARDHSCYAKSF